MRTYPQKHTNTCKTHIHTYNHWKCKDNTSSACPASSSLTIRLTAYTVPLLRSHQPRPDNEIQVQTTHHPPDITNPALTPQVMSNKDKGKGGRV